MAAGRRPCRAPGRIGGWLDRRRARGASALKTAGAGFGVPNPGPRAAGGMDPEVPRPPAATASPSGAAAASSTPPKRPRRKSPWKTARRCAEARGSAGSAGRCGPGELRKEIIVRGAAVLWYDFRVRQSAYVTPGMPSSPSCHAFQPSTRGVRGLRTVAACRTGLRPGPTFQAGIARQIT